MFATRHQRYYFINSTHRPTSKEDFVGAVTVINPIPNDPDLRDSEWEALADAGRFHPGRIEGHDRRLLEMGLCGLPAEAFVAEKQRYDMARAAVAIVELERINIRWAAIEVELTDIADCKVIDGDPAQRDRELLNEQDRLHFEAGVYDEWLRSTNSDC